MWRLGLWTAVYGLPAPNSLFKKENNQNPRDHVFRGVRCIEETTACSCSAEMSGKAGLLPNKIQKQEDMSRR